MRLTDLLLSPNGRLSRAGFWAGSIGLTAGVAAIAYGLRAGEGVLASRDYVPFSPVGTLNGPLWVMLVLAVPVAWISFCLMVKRWHDRGKSGVWVLLAFVPVLGQVWALVECALMPGVKSGNRYGSSPLRATTRHMPAPVGDIPEDMADMV